MLLVISIITLIASICMFVESLVERDMAVSFFSLASLVGCLGFFIVALARYLGMGC